MNDVISANRERLHALKDELAERFWQDDPIEDLLKDHSDGMDDIIREIFDRHFAAEDKDTRGVALFAVGGYGRQELHPGSDIDLLIVATKPQAIKRKLELFWQEVFDLNIEVGHSVRDIKTCKTEAKNDITVATAMFERRLLRGSTQLSDKLTAALDKSRVWPPDKFFRAKSDEQARRHKQHNNTEYNLEPNIKRSPGGLRDIHTALWICERQFGTTDPDKLVELNVLSPLEKQWLLDGRRFIWWVRFGLHLVAGRKEDQLQFAYQRELAERLGFADTDAQRGVERFMHHYYRHVLALTEVNDILLQHFTEVVVPTRKVSAEPINDRFHLINNYIEVRSPSIFKSTPTAILEMFVIMANRRDIAGVRAATIRLVRENLDLIDDDFRNDPANTKLFMDLLKAPYTLVSQLTRMRRYGLLGRYIPEFGQVIGQMQHDLFHIYTVDAHTMMVIGNMRRFRYRASEQNFPVAYHCVHTIPKVELLYIAGMYHDIGKGRGGDHSELGAVDARAFCQRHQLSEADTELVCWLVERHLYMSTVSQREDIYDPEIVFNFATVVKSEMRLDYLYALTVADINATNPTLWNSWRATLLRQLYNETRRVLRRGLESAADRQAAIAAYQERALDRIAAQHPELEPARVSELWQDLGDDFFLRHSPRRIANLTTAILARNTTEPFVHIEDIRGDSQGEGATCCYVYSEDRPHLFASTILALGKFDLSVVAASVNTGISGQCFDTYTVLNADGEPVERNETLRAQITEALQQALTNTDVALPKSTRRLPRQLRELPWPTEVEIGPTPAGDGTVLTILASDRPGLLATIALLFIEFELQLVSAKITTLGERVEDTFVVVDQQGYPIAPGEASYNIQQAIRQRLDQAVGQL